MSWFELGENYIIQKHSMVSREQVSTNESKDKALMANQRHGNKNLVILDDHKDLMIADAVKPLFKTVDQIVSNMFKPVH